MKIGLLVVTLRLPTCVSLKQKRVLLKSLIARLKNKFNLAAAETDFQNNHQKAAVSCVTVSTSTAVIDSELTAVQNMIEDFRLGELEVIDISRELI